jgi:ribosomal 50S subunit-recycling heat shock protein
VDVFLKQSRLVKRRSIAKELCDEGCVLVNGRDARAGREVDAGDEITLNLRDRSLAVEVLSIPERPPSAAGAKEIYRVVRDDRRTEDEDI